MFLVAWSGAGLVAASKIEALQTSASMTARSGFARVSSEVSGVTFSHVIPDARSLTNQMLLDGAGVALADVDADGLVDIFFGGSNGQSQLWKNLGNWKFRDVTAAAFPTRTTALSGDITGVAFADFNGDGKPDLVINSHAHGIRVLLNEGPGVFHRLEFPQSRARGGHSLAIADVDGDGWLDIYVCNYRERALMDMPSARATFKSINGVQMVATLDGRPTSDLDLTNRFVVAPGGRLDELGEPDVLYQNLRGTNFTVVGWIQGGFLDEDGKSLAEPPRDWGLAAQFCDVNEDGRPDLYVCNDFQTPDRFWLNESTPGAIRFRLVPRAALRHTSLFSMGVDFGDINRDSIWDFVVLDMLSPDHVRRLTTMEGASTADNEPEAAHSRPQSDANTLFIGRVDGSFAEVANIAGVMATDWSWTPAFMDVDLDGWPDLLVTAGQHRGSRDLDQAESLKAFRRAGLRTDAQILRERQKFPPHHSSLKAFRNRPSAYSGGIPRFEDVSAAWGFDYLGVSHGMAFGDLDGDGDLDVVINHLQTPAGLYRNESSAPRVAVRLKARGSSASAAGARMRFYWMGDSSADPLPQTAQVIIGGRYLSSDDSSKTFACPGLGRGTLEIRWPHGQISIETNLLANHRYEIEEPAGSSSTSNASIFPRASRRRLHFESKAMSLPVDRSPNAGFEIQPSLPRRLTTHSPSFAARVTEAENSRLWIGASDQPIRQVQIASDSVGKPRTLGAARSTLGLVKWGGSLIAASRSGTNSTLSWIDEENGSERLLSTFAGSVTCLAVSSSAPAIGAYLFVGAGATPGDYPRSRNSQLLEWDGTGLRLALTTNLGLVTGAVFAGLDSTPGVELVTVSEWGTPRILRCGGQGIQEWDPSVVFGKSAAVPLSSLTGWWRSIAAADLDRDERTDLVLGNWGFNSSYALYTGFPSGGDGSVRPLRLYHAIFVAGARTCFEAYTSDDQRILPIHGLARVSRHLPWIGGQFPTHREYASASVDQILGERRSMMGMLECRWLTSLVLLNRGDYFEARPLPDLAQLGPINSLQPADFDGDGRMDLYAAQGFFGHGHGRMREDAGEGCFLLGRGDGNFDSVSTAEANFRVLGEQQSTFTGDLDGDQRSDLVIGEYGGAVTILLNRSTRQ